MDDITCLPQRPIKKSGPISEKFLELGVESFIAACRYVRDLPYGYNSDRDKPMILFSENMGSCTTKHAVIATLAKEMDLPVAKRIGIYPMTEEIVTGTDAILRKFRIPYVPMVHCFLVFRDWRVDLTEGNKNGKNRSIETFLHMENVAANISARDEYMLYRNALKERILKLREWKDTALKTILHAREDGLVLLKENWNRSTPMER
jgi:hypothetical protein